MGISLTFEVQVQASARINKYRFIVVLFRRNIWLTSKNRRLLATKDQERRNIITEILHCIVISEHQIRWH